MSQTQRLFWSDPYITRFSATILDARPGDGRWRVVLDATAFYPSSGGQPHDTGRLGDAQVLDVLEEGDAIVHVLDQRPQGDRVEGIVDWERRFDHMQQHTGQHILSAAFEQVLDAGTVSFHLGAEESTIDLGISALEDGDLVRVEELANRIVLENRPVRAAEYTTDQVLALPLRRVPQLRERIRVVLVEGFDACACGGTHVRATGEIGLVHIRRAERRRGGVRVTFLCGWRAIRALRERNGLVQNLGASLSVGAPELVEAVGRLQAAAREAERDLQALRHELIAYQTADLARAATPAGAAHLVCQVLEGHDPGSARALAQSLLQIEGLVVLLGVPGAAPQVIFGRSPDLDLDVLALLREALGVHGGRGGGAPHLAQGGGIAPEALPRVLEYAREALAARLEV